MRLIDMVEQNQSMRVATGVLNEIMAEAVALQQPPSDKGKRLRLYYITQVAVKPPTFVIFVNDKQLMHFSYTRYIENKIRDTFGFKGTLAAISSSGSGRRRINKSDNQDKQARAGKWNELLCLAIGYVFGLFQTGIYLRKAAPDRHPWMHGSGNAGTTNMHHVRSGTKAGADRAARRCV